MLSKSSKYAIKAVTFLALNSSKKKKVMVKDIAEPINVPQAYIAKLLQDLVRFNIVSSVRGPKGGFYLDDKNKEQSVFSIINVIDGEKKLSTCMLSLGSCNETKPCPLHNILSASRDEILKNLKDKTIKELSLDVKSGNSFLPL
ncbi:RrF2 family transcriptional regulator [Thalassobellus suaedae]|uniref:Rrf2 family transcriptional regulator n=1 Tax=Thalassobellus suaedae TaxID=3074124 RepID=A0ABY9Y8Y7_9FLAO|nr:Rrf2 family transcriptional regulator [Flavobacteriaceae bacterium HL-DH10]